MAQTREFEPIDTRFALRVHAAVVGVSGIVLVGWGQMWLGSHLATLPWGKAVLIRIFGAGMIAIGVLAVGLAETDQRARRQLLSWFIAAQVVVWLVLGIQIAGPLGGLPLVRPASWVMLASILGLLYVRDRTDNQMETDGNYEQQIREAAAQEERNRLARDLHDAVKQQIFAIQTSAATAEARLVTDVTGSRDALAQVRQSAREAMAEMEAMLDQLRVSPLGNTGLVEAIRKHCEALAFRTGASVDVRVGDLPGDDVLGPGTHQAIFRIVQEALANVGRHARANRVHVSFEATPDCLEVAVRDDGSGFDPRRAPGGMGIQNMRARAREIGGNIDVSSADGAGTRVTLSIPFETVETRRYRQRRALGLAGVLGVAIALLLLDLVKWGPALGNVALIVFALLFIRYVRIWLRLRRRDGAPAIARHERAS